jgi:toxin YoeB
MKTAWTEAAWHDYLHWSHADQRMRARIDELICDINGVPFKGLGTPQPLQHALQGWSSRRIYKARSRYQECIEFIARIAR